MRRVVIITAFTITLFALIDVGIWVYYQSHYRGSQGTTTLERLRQIDSAKGPPPARPAP